MKNRPRTPAPWTVAYSASQDGHGGTSHYSVKHGSETICRSIGQIADERDEANFHFLATAPEMHDTLSKLLDYMPEDWKNDPRAWPAGLIMRATELVARGAAVTQRPEIMARKALNAPSGRYAMICSRCHSRSVGRDAWAEWDVTQQAWILRGEPFDQAYCFDCEGETSLEEKEI